MDLNSVPVQILYQGIGIVALILSVLSFQFKKFKTILLLQGASSILWCLHFLIAHAYSGLFMNAIAIVRALGFAYITEKKKRLGFVIIICSAFAGAALLSFLYFNELFFIAIVTAAASIVGSIFFYLDNARNYKIAQLGFISPCWLFNNIWYLSIGGIICESFNIVSIIVAFIRFKIADKRKNIEQKSE